MKNERKKKTAIYPLNQRWRGGPRSSQKIVLMPANQKIIVRIKAGGKETKKKNPHKFQFERQGGFF